MDKGGGAICWNFHRCFYANLILRLLSSDSSLTQQPLPAAITVLSKLVSSVFCKWVETPVDKVVKTGVELTLRGKLWTRRLHSTFSSWLLREAVCQDKLPIRTFLKQHQSNGNITDKEIVSTWVKDCFFHPLADSFLLIMGSMWLRLHNNS